PRPSRFGARLPTWSRSRRTGGPSRSERFAPPGSTTSATVTRSLGSGRASPETAERRADRVFAHTRVMRFDKTLEIERAMAIYAHPDDAEFGMAGTVAKWANAGVEFTYCMVTNGASGSQDPEMTRERLRDIRAAEQREAAAILGVRNVVFLEFEDGYLEPTIDVRRAVAR